MKGKSKEPCQNHRLAFASNRVPEAKHYKLIRCNRCGWWIRNYGRKDKRERLDRYGRLIFKWKGGVK